MRALVTRTGAALAVMALVLTGCARTPSDACPMTETLAEIDGEVVVFVNDCAEGFVRPATPADLASMEAPL